MKKKSNVTTKSQPESAAQDQIQENQPKDTFMTKISKGVRWYLMGLPPLLVGVFVMFAGNAVGNPILITLGVAGLAGGIMLFKHGWEISDTRVIGKSKINNANSIIMQPHEYKFCDVLNADGPEFKCLNDGKYYHAYLQSNGSGSLKEFTLPDNEDSERYYDPGELANVVEMLANKKYLNYSATTWQKISVGILGMVIGGELIGLVALGG